MRAEESRLQLQQLVNHRPFEPFVISLENGDRLTVEHPENLAFDPQEGGVTRFYLISRSLSIFGTLDTITSVVMQDTGRTVGT